ncbi:nucleoside triphosphate pyrophosphohydrolase MazG [Legionella birminghamensis]|uniref:Nucleoside triphosphate pyrophosphohydrolase MazG n=1 Tax=Legionella birminghamensis TaxID=28083 RepID=A0A378IBN0_9GAMM|nr:MazG nucleotide pyrophosphohydrolase domain-containing protein [Legionella birminghamensis]KTC74498.1 nucleoside triphosphate pyrophosphohydrolase MazG [Legionella birminghamensis]STX32627.1 nucleoside triphosphate pyrophosphohydrolase MazG [Legionella birminghamensis]
MNLFNKLVNLELDATQFGFRWENARQILAQIESECAEVNQTLDQEEASDLLQYEIGDLLHAVLSLCLFCGFDPELTLENSLNKFEQRFLAVKQLAKAKGLNHLNHFSFEQLMELWTEAKILSDNKERKS